ncbi:MAG: hypothetical protein IPL79_20035 [Myxococcales bacterium]|nr:hypothetical protein [Myxococcales bacterium]
MVALLALGFFAAPRRFGDYSPIVANMEAENLTARPLAVVKILEHAVTV